MKRVLSWLALIGCFFLFCLVATLDSLLISYISSLYSQLSPFLKLVIIIIGGAFILGLTLTPIYYGAILTITWCEGIYPSVKGSRYIVMGVVVIILCVIDLVHGFRTSDIIVGIYGIALMIFGRSKRKTA